MGLVRGIVNYTDFVDMLFDNREDDRYNPIRTRKGEQRTKGFKLDKENKNIEWYYEKDIVINELHFASTKKTNFGQLAIDIYVISKNGKKNTIIDNMYIKTLYEKKDLLSPFVLNFTETLFIDIKNTEEDNDNCVVYVDIDFYVVKDKPGKPEIDSQNFNN